MSDQPSHPLHSSHDSDMTKSQTLHAYRNLYRHALRAVHHSSPARFTLRDTMRQAFRSESVDSLDPIRVKRTLQFLKHAELESGTEHKILKNLLHTRWWQAQRQKDNKL